MITPKLHFLGWNKSAIEIVAEHLLSHLTNPVTASQYRRATVVVPTAESGRRLREYMAEMAGKPILMPNIKQASHLITYEREYSDIQEYAAWIQVLNNYIPHVEWPNLFPTPPRSQLSWSHGMGHQLMQLHRKLDEACLSPKQIAQDLDKQNNEREATRWSEIADIFHKVESLLSEWGFTPEAKLHQAAFHATVDKLAAQLLIVACLPQMTERFRRLLDAITQRQGDVHIYIHAPAEHQGKCLRDFFHARYGTPLSIWQDEPINIPDEALQVVADGGGMTLAALRACEHHTSEQVVLGCCDASFAPMLRQGFANAGWSLNMPEGRSFLTTDAGQLAGQLLRAHSQAPRLHATEALLRNAALQRSFGFSPNDQLKFNSWLDKELQEKMTTSTEELIKHAYAQKDTHSGFVEYLRHMEQLLKQVSHMQTLPQALQQLGNSMQRAYANSLDALIMKSFALLLQEVANTLTQPRIFRSPTEVLALLQTLINQHAAKELSMVSTPREQTAMDASGWMELPYCRGSKLILCGMHEQCVPERPSVDAFLPESLCKHYDELPSMSQRLARDSFMLTALLHAYPHNTHILVAQAADDGTPLVPSQLLLRYPNEQQHLLLSRINTLFTPKPPDILGITPGVWKMRTPMEQVVAMEHVSMLKPGIENPWADLNKHFSPSSLASFLTCPLRFWLDKLLGLNPQDVYEEGKTSLNAAEYGTMLHKVLELTVRDCSADMQRGDIEEKALAHLETEYTHKYGNTSSMPMLAQKKMQESSLRAFAEHLAKDLQAGWEHVYLEHHVEDLGWVMEDDIIFHMTIDRVDRKKKADGSGYLWRIIDYKTGDKKPQDKHMEKLKPEQAGLFERLMPDFPLLQKEVKGKKNEEPQLCSYRWKELQLPLYAFWLMDTHRIPLEDIEVGYYLLPRNKKECKYESWTISQEEMDSAMTWVKAAVSQIRAGRCLISAESLGLSAYSDFGALAPEGDPRLMMGLPDLSPPEN